MTFTVLNKQNRQGATTTQSVTVPENPPDSFVATILIDLADMEDTATRISLAAQVSADSGTTWTNIGAGTWEGGPQDQKNGVTPQWRLIVGKLPDHVGRLLRGVLTVEPRTSVGLSVTV
jgi:hypothetical protein